MTNRDLDVAWHDLPTSDTTAKVRLKCVREGYDLAELDVRGDYSTIDFDQSHDCRFAWLTIDAISREGGGENDLAIGSISLARR